MTVKAKRSRQCAGDTRLHRRELHHEKAVRKFITVTRTEVFLSADLLSLVYGTSRGRQLSPQDSVIVCYDSSTVLMTSDITFLQTLHHHFCNRKERKWNIPFTRLFSPPCAKNGLGTRLIKDWRWERPGNEARCTCLESKYQGCPALSWSASMLLCFVTISLSAHFNNVFSLTPTLLHQFSCCQLYAALQLSNINTKLQLACRSSPQNCTVL